MLIADSPVGQDLRLTSVDLDDGHAFRLRELGLAPGVRLKVVQRAAFGGRVVQIRGERIAVDAVTAKRLHAEIVAEALPDGAAAESEPSPGLSGVTRLPSSRPAGELASGPAA